MHDDAIIKQIQERIEEQSDDAAYEDEIRQVAKAGFFSRMKVYSMESIHARVRSTSETRHKASWQLYGRPLDQAAHSTWCTSHAQSLKKLDRDYILPLARMHVSWVSHELFKNYFDAAFDSHAPTSGAAFTGTLAKCYWGVQDKCPCLAHLENEAKKEVGKESLLFRGLLFNQKNLLEKARKSVQNLASINQPALDLLRGLPWDSFVGAFNQTLEKAGVYADGSLGAFITNLGAPIVNALRWSSGLDTGGVQKLVAYGMACGQGIIPVKITNSNELILKRILTYLITFQDKNGKLTPDKINHAVTAKIGQLRIRGASLGGQMSSTIMITLDTKMIKEMPLNLGPEQQTKWIAKALGLYDELELVNVVRWRTKMTRVLGGKGAPLAVGILTGLLQAASLTKLQEDVDKATSIDLKEAKSRRLAGSAAFLATIAQTIGKAIENNANKMLRIAGKIAGFVGRAVLGLGAGLVMAWLDAQKGWEAAKQGDYGLAFAYFVTAGLGVGAAICAVLSASWAGPVGWVLAGLAILVTMYMELFIKRDKTQDWLLKCSWGSRPAERYQDFTLSVKDLEVAMAG